MQASDRQTAADLGPEERVRLGLDSVMQCANIPEAPFDALSRPVREHEAANQHGLVNSEPVAETNVSKATTNAETEETLTDASNGSDCEDVADQLGILKTALGASTSAVSGTSVCAIHNEMLPGTLSRLSGARKNLDGACKQRTALRDGSGVLFCCAR